MSDKLWFITENGELIRVYDDSDIAREELFYLKMDNPTEKFRVYGLMKVELDDYDDEKQFAESEGLLVP